jgi:hypothetical protein
MGGWQIRVCRPSPQHLLTLVLRAFILTVGEDGVGNSRFVSSCAQIRIATDFDRPHSRMSNRDTNHWTETKLHPKGTALRPDSRHDASIMPESSLLVSPID